MVTKLSLYVDFQAVIIDITIFVMQDCYEAETEYIYSYRDVYMEISY